MIRPRRPRRSVNLWTALVPAVALVAGLLLATTARAARGTDLRSAGRSNVADLIRAAETRGASIQQQVRQLQDEVAARTDRLATADAGVGAIDSGAAPLKEPAGLTAMSGPGVTLTLDDSHATITDPNVDPNWLVVHQSDMQAAVNALWAGGAEAMQVQDQRLIQTSAIRCVGNTLLLNGRVYSPPFSIRAIGPQDAMRRALDASRNLKQYREDADSYGLKYTLKNESRIDVVAFDAPIGLNYATIGR